MLYLYWNLFTYYVIFFCSIWLKQSFFHGYSLASRRCSWCCCSTTTRTSARLTRGRGVASPSLETESWSVGWRPPRLASPSASTCCSDSSTIRRRRTNTWCQSRTSKPASTRLRSPGSDTQPRSGSIRLRCLSSKPATRRPVTESNELFHFACVVPPFL